MRNEREICNWSWLAAAHIVDYNMRAVCYLGSVLSAAAVDGEREKEKDAIGVTELWTAAGVVSEELSQISHLACVLRACYIVVYDIWLHASWTQ